MATAGKSRMIVALVLMALMARMASGSTDCSMVKALFTVCSDYITFNTPEPALDSPCCNSVVSLDNMADSVDNRRSICSCLMAIIDAYNTKATATATAHLPGLCGISFGFTIDPNTDCNTVP